MDNHNEIHIGINIGAMKTVYSKCYRNNNQFLTEVLLSDVASRTIPSQICYTNTNRLYGETSNSKMNRFLNTSYFNISRFIGFINNNFFKKELEYLEKDIFDSNKDKFKIYNNEYENSSIIIADYLSLINNYFFKEQKIQYDYVTFSVPDYYTLYQKNNLKIIANAIGMKNVNVINESTAITIHYGYTKHYDMFQNQKDKEKHVIFIDSGHSKTSFIYSIFKQDEYQVKKVKVLPFTGGRNFDKVIFKDCIEHFKKENSIQKDDKKFESSFKLHKKELLDAIKKAKKILTVNEDTDIIIDPFIGGEIALKYNLTRKNFEKLIEGYLNIILENFKEFIKDINIENVKVEIAGEIMRIPKIQQLFENDLRENIKLSKTILIDESASLGAAFYGFFNNKNKFPIKSLKKIIPYNYFDINVQLKIDNIEKYTKLYQNNFNILLEKIELDVKEISKEIMINFKYEDPIVKQFFPEKNKYIYSYLIDINKLKKDNEELFKNASKILVEFININNEMNIKLYLILKNGEKKKCKYSTDLSTKGIINKNNNNKEEKIKGIIEKHYNFDNLYNTYISKKNGLMKLVYKLKDKNNNNKEKFQEYNERIKKIINDDKLDLIKKISGLDKIKEDIEKELKIKLNKEEMEYESEKQKLIEKIENKKEEINKKKKEQENNILNFKYGNNLTKEGIIINTLTPKEEIKGIKIIEENNKKQKNKNKKENDNIVPISEDNFFDELIEKINNIPFNKKSEFDEINLNWKKKMIEHYNQKMKKQFKNAIEELLKHEKYKEYHSQIKHYEKLVDKNELSIEYVLEHIFHIKKIVH